jgi:monooxygenase
MVTDHVDTFTPRGLRLKSGKELPADLVVTATGLELQVLGGIALEVDGVPRGPGRHLQLQGNDVQRRAQPGLVVRLHQRLVDAEERPDLRVRLPVAQPHGETRLAAVHAAQQRPRAGTAAMAGFFVGLCERAVGKLSEAGSRAPWRVHQNYARDLLSLRFGPVEDGVMKFRAIPVNSPVA